MTHETTMPISRNLAPSCHENSGGPASPADQSKIVEATKALQIQGDRLNHSTDTLRKRLDTALGAAANLKEEPTPPAPLAPGSSAAKMPSLPDIDSLFRAVENVEREYRYLVMQLERIIPLTGE